MGAAVAVAAVLLATGCTSAVPSALDGAAREVDPDALASDGCGTVEPGDLDDREHLDPQTAPPADVLYDVPLPAAGPHFGRWAPVEAGLPSRPQDPRALLHNMEHGAVVLWIDPQRVDAATRSFIADWRDQLGRAGFDNEQTGASVFVSLVPGDVEVDAAVALRAWGVALDCDAWDLAVADAFVGIHYGSRGSAPESELGPWPSGNGVLVGPPGVDDGQTSTV